MSVVRCCASSFSASMLRGMIRVWLCHPGGPARIRVLGLKITPCISQHTLLHGITANATLKNYSLCDGTHYIDTWAIPDIIHASTPDS